MPIYLYQCSKCERKLNTIQGMNEGLPLCCDKFMTRLPTAPSLIRVKGTGGVTSYSTNYKKDYSKEYLKSIES